MSEIAPTAVLTGQVAVVTGASGGMGRAIACELARAGANVVVHTRARRDAAEATAQEIRGHGQDACVLLADLADEEQVADLVEQCWNWRNGVDIWINNAGADVLTGDAASATFTEKLDRLWQVDVRGTLAASRDVGRRMAARGGPPGAACILNMGWDQAEHGMAGDSGEMFAAVKAAVMAFSRSLAASLAPHVRVNCLAPGWIRTAWGAGASEYWRDRAVGEALLGRWGEAEDVARVACFLASPQAAFVNGQIVNINGGFRYGD